MAFTVIRRLCRGRLTAAILACAAAFLALPGGAAWAQAGAIYTATGIDVDVTGDIATLRDQALLQGQRLGLQKVLAEIAPAERVQALVEPDNGASIRVLEKCGYEREGLLRKFYPSVDRGLIDVFMYASIA